VHIVKLYLAMTTLRSSMPSTMLLLGSSDERRCGPALVGNY
jgi:hypothetical protein